MDAAVGLVEAYLHANGYLTVTEFPVVEALEEGGYRSVTDIDMLAVRLPGAGRIVPMRGSPAAHEERLVEPDPSLVDDRSDGLIDFIIGEVKEGRAELNRGARTARTLIIAIRRFMFVPPEVAKDLADELLKEGRVVLPDRKLQLRLFAFGSRPSREATTRYSVILLKQCIQFLVDIGLTHSAMATASQHKNPTLNLLAILLKSGFASEPGDQS